MIFLFVYIIVWNFYARYVKMLRKKGRWLVIKLLFFDMEFANGRVVGSVYSFGYLITDENFRILTPPTDLLINPACEWNEYVETHILGYPKEVIEAAPEFPSVYDEICGLFSSVDLAVGFSLNNDIRALRADCERYALTPLEYSWLDLERLCKRLDVHREAHGLEGCFAAWCGEPIPAGRHKSDVDAHMTASLLGAICRQLHVDVTMLSVAYPTCVGRAEAVLKPTKKKNEEKRRPRRRRHQKGKRTKETGAQ